MFILMHKNYIKLQLLLVVFLVVVLLGAVFLGVVFLVNKFLVNTFLVLVNVLVNKVRWSASGPDRIVWSARTNISVPGSLLVIVLLTVTVFFKIVSREPEIRMNSIG